MITSERISASQPAKQAERAAAAAVSRVVFAGSSTELAAWDEKGSAGKDWDGEGDERGEAELLVVLLVVVAAGTLNRHYQFHSRPLSAASEISVCLLIFFVCECEDTG
jgi:hypothetical protein